MDSCRTLPPAAALAVAVAAVLNPSCGGSSPSSSTTPSTTLTPAATQPSTESCRFGRGIPYPACDRTTSQLLPDVDAAIDRLVRERPGIFDLSNEAYSGTKTYKVLDMGAYLDGLVANLVSAGLCAERDVDDPDQQAIRVKDSNEFSEDFDVVLKDGFIRRGPGSYAVTCTPPNFPATRPVD